MHGPAKPLRIAGDGAEQAPIAVHVSIGSSALYLVEASFQSFGENPNAWL